MPAIIQKLLCSFINWSINPHRKVPNQCFMWYNMKIARLFFIFTICLWLLFKLWWNRLCEARDFLSHHLFTQNCYNDHDRTAIRTAFGFVWPQKTVFLYPTKRAHIPTTENSAATNTAVSIAFFGRHISPLQHHWHQHLDFRIVCQRPAHQRPNNSGNLDCPAEQRIFGGPVFSHIHPRAALYC